MAVTHQKSAAPLASARRPDSGHPSRRDAVQKERGLLFEVPSLHVGKPLVLDGNIVHQLGVESVALGLKVQDEHGNLLIDVLAPGLVVLLGWDPAKGRRLLNLYLILDVFTKICMPPRG